MSVVLVTGGTGSESGLSYAAPEIRTVWELLDLWPGRLRVLPLPIVGRLLHALAEGRNTTAAHADGRLTRAQYLARR